MTARRLGTGLLLLIALALGWRQWPATHDSPAATTTTQETATPQATAAALPAFLPAEAHATITLIQRGGPFPHRQDGQTFGNREGLLPRQPRGWYREYTVDTPGLNHRGARRIVTGGQPPREWYYSDDHYRSFRRFDPPEPTP